MTQTLPRPDATPVPGPLDDRLYDLVEERFRRIIRDNPTVATFVGIHFQRRLLRDSGAPDA